MAIEDGRALAECLVREPVEQALAAYEAGRRPAVAALQDAAAASSRWFESIDEHLDCPPFGIRRTVEEQGRTGF